MAQFEQIIIFKKITSEFCTEEKNLFILSKISELLIEVIILIIEEINQHANFVDRVFPFFSVYQCIDAVNHIFKKGKIV